MNRPQLTVKFEPHHVCIGLIWHWFPRHDPADIYDYSEFQLVVHILPMLPIRLTLTWGGVEFRGGM